MPKSKVSNPITDKEIAFARLVLSGTMTDRDAAQAAGLNPDTAAYTKAKSRVRAYLLEHRAAVQQQLVEQDAERAGRFNLGREQVLQRLWEISTMGPERTRGSMTAQVKALSIIVAMEGYIPDRRAGSAEKPSAPPPIERQFYTAAWLREQQARAAGATTSDPEPNPPTTQEENSLNVSEPEPAPVPIADLPPNHGEPSFANRVSPSEAMRWQSYAPSSDSARDTRVPFSIRRKRPFA